jgi:hypothetical protein
LAGTDAVGNGNTCPAGTYNLDTGAKSISECKDCSMGYFCLGGTNVETLCPLGYYSDQVKVAAETDSDPSVR